MTKSIPLQEGQKFNRLTIIKLDHIKKYKNQNIEFYLCKCDCGNECIVSKPCLKKNDIKSCGCLRKETQLKNCKTHGFKNTRLYRIWGGMKARCYIKTATSYKNYGARHITVCDEWKNDFMSFYNWAMDNGYAEKLELDRIDNNGNYEPNNCRWVTRKENCNNTRKNIYLKYNNEVYTISEWSSKLKIQYSKFYRYLKNNNEFSRLG